MLVPTRELAVQVQEVTDKVHTVRVRVRLGLGLCIRLYPMFLTLSTQGDQEVSLAGVWYNYGGREEEGRDNPVTSVPEQAQHLIAEARLCPNPNPIFVGG